MLRAICALWLTALLAFGASAASAQNCCPAIPAAAPTPIVPAVAPTPIVPAVAPQLLKGLISYWKFDDASGTSVADSVSTNTGTWHGTLGSQWTTGIINGAGSFNGTNNYVATATSTPFQFTSSFSVSFWLQVPTNLASTYTGVIGTYGATSGWDIGIQNGKIRAALRGTSSIAVGSGGQGSDLRDAKWHHVVVVNTPIGITEYQDGVFQNTLAGTWVSTTNAQPLYIGQRGDGTVFVTGSIDEVGIWNRAIAGDEVVELYNGGHGNVFINNSCGFTN
jgi:hypothetical protein